MNAILGRIAKIRKLKAGRGSTGSSHRVKVSFKPACVMPGRTVVPEWLKDQVLDVTRVVPDMRELGNVGDSIVLTPAESRQWLYPLVVEPAVAHGKVPARIDLRLRWWKDKKPGKFTVSANGRRRTGAFTRHGKTFTASVAMGSFFDGAPSLPADVEVSFDKLTLGCGVLPGDRPCYRKLKTRQGERHRVESQWYALEVARDANGGVSMLREMGRDLDHFRADDDVIHGLFEQSGHVDVIQLGWADWSGRAESAPMTSVAARQDGEATHLHLEGVLDKARGIRSTASYTVFHRLPLVLLQRDVFVPKQEDKKDDEKEQKTPVEPIDRMVRVLVGFRAAFLAERNECFGSRILSVDDGRFAVLRWARAHGRLRNGWKLKDGWAIVEHPARRACMMYLFDSHNAPVLQARLGGPTLTLEPYWCPVPVMPASGAGFVTAFTAGEVCGADVAGAWVACRRRASTGGVECAVVGRFRRMQEELTAEIRVGSRSATVPMKQLFLAGVGRVCVASLHLPRARMRGNFDVIAGGIPARRP